MRVKKNFTVGSIEGAAVGDLLKITYGNHQTDIAIFFGGEMNEAFLLVVKSDGDAGEVPYADIGPKDFDCVNYGAGWYIEALDSFEDKLGLAPIKHGSLAFTADSPILCLGPRNKAGLGSQPRYMNLETLKIHSGTPQHAYILNRWRLWLNADDQENGEEPFFEFEAYEPKPR